MTIEVLAILVFINLLATVSLWRMAARRPEKLKKKFVEALQRGKPIVPKHQPPKSIGDAPLRDRGEQYFFVDFADFANVVNWWLADPEIGGPWRLQELPDTELKLGRSEMPGFGRRYAVFHNQVLIGTLEVSPSFGYRSEKPTIHTHLEIEWVRLLRYGNVLGFLDAIAMHVCDPRDSQVDYLQTQLTIERACNQVLWQVQHIYGNDLDGQSYGELELVLHGSAAWYLQRKKAFLSRPPAEAAQAKSH